jgi:hypothetical protein
MINCAHRHIRARYGPQMAAAKKAKAAGSGAGARGEVSFEFPAITSVHRMFLQMVVASSGHLRQDDAAAHLARMARECPLGRGGLPEEEFTLRKAVDTLNPGLAFLEMRLEFVRGEGDGRLYVVLCNTKADALAKDVATPDKMDAVAVLKVVLNYLVAKKCAIWGRRGGGWRQLKQLLLPPVFFSPPPRLHYHGLPRKHSHTPPQWRPVPGRASEHELWQPVCAAGGLHGPARP